MSTKSILCASLAAVAAFWILPTSARGDQVYFANYGSFSSNPPAYILGSGGIGEYTTPGGPLNASLVTGVTAPYNLAVSGSNLFITSAVSGTQPDTIVGEYTTSEATVNAALITGLPYPQGIAVSGSDLFVANYSGTIGEYTTSGATVNAALVSGLLPPSGIVASGSDLFVVLDGTTVAEYTTSGTLVNASVFTSPNEEVEGIAVSGGNLFIAIQGSYTTLGDYIPYSGSIREYTTSGVPVNTALVTGLYDPTYIAVSGSNLYFVSSPEPATSVVSEYTTSGALVNASLITGEAVNQIVAVPTPEPSTWALLATGAGALLLFGRRNRGAARDGYSVPAAIWAICRSTRQPA